MGPSRLSLTKPTIAAVEGYAVAGGLELAFAGRCPGVSRVERELSASFPPRWSIVVHSPLLRVEKPQT
jgi:hypothetical protein